MAIRRRYPRATTPNVTVSSPTAAIDQNAGVMLPRRPQKIKVRLTKQPNGYYTLKCSHPLPPVELVRKLLPSTSQIAINGYYHSYLALDSLINTVRGLVKPRDWAKAISRAIAQQLSTESDVEYELIAAPGGGYLCIGNALFRMEAVDYIEGTNKALPALRKAVMEDARKEGQSIIDASHVKANKIQRDADAYSLRVNTECAKIKDEHKHLQSELALAIPTWIQDSHIMVRSQSYDYGNTKFLQLGLFIDIGIDWFEWKIVRKSGAETKVTTHRLAALKAPPFKILVWANVRQSPGDTFDPHSVALDVDFLGGHLPHMSGHSCMSLGDTPININSLATLGTLRRGIARAMSVVNLDSLLTSLGNWPDAMLATIPEAVKECLNGSKPFSSLKADEKESNTPVLFNLPNEPQPELEVEPDIE